MPPGIRVAALVEGSHHVDDKPNHFRKLWQEVIPEGFGLVRFDRIIPISKTNILAMDPGSMMSGQAIPLDTLLHDQWQREQFEAAVIIWDLTPPWQSRETPSGKSRWKESPKLYDCLSRSAHLPPGWRSKALARFTEMTRRPCPGARAGLQPLEEGQILAVCMEPVFEGLLVQCEGVLRQSLGVTGRKPSGWPSRQQLKVLDPEVVLQNAIIAAKGIRPSPQIFRQIRGTMKDAKHEWAAYWLETMLSDAKCRAALAAHPIARRLTELLNASRV